MINPFYYIIQVFMLVPALDFLLLQDDFLFWPNPERVFFFYTKGPPVKIHSDQIYIRLIDRPVFCNRERNVAIYAGKQFIYIMPSLKRANCTIKFRLKPIPRRYKTVFLFQKCWKYEKTRTCFLASFIVLLVKIQIYMENKIQKVKKKSIIPRIYIHTFNLAHLRIAHYLSCRGASARKTAGKFTQETPSLRVEGRRKAGLPSLRNRVLKAWPSTQRCQHCMGINFGVVVKFNYLFFFPRTFFTFPGHCQHAAQTVYERWPVRGPRACIQRSLGQTYLNRMDRTAVTFVSSLCRGAWCTHARSQMCRVSTFRCHVGFRLGGAVLSDNAGGFYA